MCTCDGARTRLVGKNLGLSEAPPLSQVGGKRLPACSNDLRIRRGPPGPVALLAAEVGATPLQMERDQSNRLYEEPHEQAGRTTVAASGSGIPRPDERADRAVRTDPAGTERHVGSLRNSDPVIAVNGSFLTADVTGVQRFAFQLLIGLLEAAPQLSVRVYVPAQPLPRPAMLQELKDAGADVVIAPAWARNKQVFEQVALPWMAAGHGVDCLVHLSNSMSIACRVRQICFLYDLSPVRFAHTFKPTYRAKFRAVLLAAKHHKAAIATLSAFSRTELESVGLEDITVVPAGLGSPMLLGSMAETNDERRTREDVPDTFALILGSSDPRKRVAQVVQSWDDVYCRLGLPLVVVEGASRLQRSPPAIERSPGIIRLAGHVSDHDLVCLIRRSAVAVFASAYEGGALAAQEVLALGTPVVAADIPAFRELLPPGVPFFRDMSELGTLCTRAVTSPRPAQMTLQQSRMAWREAASGLLGRIEDVCAVAPVDRPR